MPKWTSWHTAAVVGFVVVFAVLGVAATQVVLTRHNHLGFWSAVVIGLLLLGLAMVVGHGISGRVDGVLIDSRGRISLSQFQLVVWTLVVLASFGGAFFTNLLANVNPVQALSISIPAELWLAMGISLGSTAGSKALNSAQGQAPDQTTALPEDFPGRNELAEKGIKQSGLLLVRDGSANAQWGDLFASDYVRDAMRVDIAKVQMFFFTVILAFGYAAAVADLLITANGPVTALPALDSGFVTLLALSQGGYVAVKASKGTGANA